MPFNLIPHSLIISIDNAIWLIIIIDSWGICEQSIISNCEICSVPAEDLVALSARPSAGTEVVYNNL